MTEYREEFYRRLEETGATAAAEIVPRVLALVPDAKSVVDVGCGIGRWLAEFGAHGLELQGVDQDQVPTELLRIPQQSFLAQDLTTPLRFDRRFDLAVSLEVAEHLPEARADDFVATLVRLAPVVLFSAAIPYQHGKGHVNCQWPSWWAEKFARHDHVAIDAIRRHVWDREDVAPWYRQNLLLYAHRDAVAQNPRLQAELERTSPGQLDLVLPGIYEGKAWPSLKQSWKLFRRRLRARAVEGD